VTIPLQDIQTIERASQVEIHLVMQDTTIKLRIPDADMDEATAGTKAQVWFDRFVVKIDQVRNEASKSMKLAGEEEDDEGHEPWDKVPEGAFAKGFFYITFPLKWAIFKTTPNVLHKEEEHKYIRCCFISAAWLAVLAFGMTECVEYLGCAIKIEPTAMGLSLGAIGTSFPNLYASILVAKAGDGVTAVCQAIASNTFNICIGLGVFWLFKSIGLTSCNYGSDGRQHQGPCNGCYGPVGSEPLCPYLEGTNNEYGSASGSTKGAIFVVYIWVGIFLYSMIFNKCHVTRPVAMAMAALYFIYMVYQILTAYGVPITICFHSLNICI
jgi:Ca2+/Na+ antiporter